MISRYRVLSITLCRPCRIGNHAGAKPGNRLELHRHHDGAGGQSSHRTRLQRSARFHPVSCVCPSCDLRRGERDRPSLSVLWPRHFSAGGRLQGSRGHRGGVPDARAVVPRSGAEPDGAVQRSTLSHSAQSIKNRWDAGRVWLLPIRSSPCAQAMGAEPRFPTRGLPCRRPACGSRLLPLLLLPPCPGSARWFLLQ